MPQLNRRQLVQSSALVGLSVATLAKIVAPVLAVENKPLAVGTRILFQGDSITDAGRDRKSDKPNNANGLGRGYPLFVAGELLRDHAVKKLEIFNRGISGNKVPDLAARWQTDCLDLQPAVVSILIGVNDIWHKLNGNYSGTVEDYATGYRKLIEDTQSKLPDTRVVICEPFVLKCGAVNDKWFPEFEERRETAVKLATDLKLTFVPFQQMFNRAVENSPPEYWAADGVHPTVAGHALMASEWRKVTGI
jgi:lysophospholipase L1-like esterase